MRFREHPRKVKKARKLILLKIFYQYHKILKWPRWRDSNPQSAYKQWGWRVPGKKEGKFLYQNKISQICLQFNRDIAD